MQENRQTVPESGHRRLRSALGRFATGITIVTAKARDGGYIGRTINSFNSVSLDPPLILWSLSRSSSGLPSFEAAGHFAVNVLSDDQIALAERFAKKGDLDPFQEIRLVEGLGGAPVLDGCAAVFECKQYRTYGAGDHLMFLGEVVNFYETEKPALVFHYGAYAVSAPHPALHRRPAEAFFFSPF